MYKRQRFVVTAKESRLVWGRGTRSKLVKFDDSNIPMLYTAPGYKKSQAFVCRAVNNQDYSVVAAAAAISDSDDSDEDDDAEDDTSLSPKDVSPTSEGAPQTEHLQPASWTEPTWFPFDHDPTTVQHQQPAVVDDPTMPEDSRSLLEWHYKLNHTSFTQLKFMAEQGDIPKKLAKCRQPKCPSCIYGKAIRRARRVKGQSAVNPPKVVTGPGQCVSVDTLESPTPGLIAQAKGSLTKSRYTKATVFVDQYSGLDYVHVHRGNTGDEVLEAKMAFERFAAQHGVTIRHYHADNGRFAEPKFQDAVKKCGQTISYCGVNAHHQNGRAERRIRTLTEAARTQLLHAQHRWPRVVNAHLWPYALKLASDLSQNIPRESREEGKNGKSPFQLFSGTTQKVSLKDYYPFGCPVYVLHETLANGKYHPKWDDRTRIGLYLGKSPHHASSVGLILNLNTGHVSPQFHCVMDANFDCVKTDPTIRSKWQRLAHLEESSDAPALQDYGTQDKIPKAFKAPWHKSKQAARAAEAREVKRTAQPSVQDIRDPGTTNEPPSKKQRTAQPEMRETEVPKAPPVTTRSGRTVQQPEWLLDSQAMSSTVEQLSFGVHGLDDGTYNGGILEPMAFAAAIPQARADNDVLNLNGARQADDWEDFKEAMAKEIAAHERRGHWIVVRADSIKDHSKVDVVQGIWSFKRKRTPTGELLKHKSRLCAHGGQQRENLTFQETYTPVVNWFTLRTLIVLSIIKGWESKQIDMILAYPQADLTSDVYMRIPFGLKVSENGDRKEYLLKLMKNIYGLKDAGRTWSEHLRKNLIGRGFVQSRVDPCLFFKGDLILVVYVDDIICFSPNSADLAWVEKSFAHSKTGKYESFEFTVEKTVEAYLGIQVTYKADGSIHMRQPFLIKRVLEAMDMDGDEKRHDTPADPSARLLKYSSSQEGKGDVNYRSVLGMMNYLAGTSRPDIAFAVHQCARYSNNPRRPHYVALRRIARYLATTDDMGMILKPNGMELVAFCDADFAGDWCKEYSEDPATAYSQSGFVVMLGGCPIVWQSKMQTEIALSSTESEYVCLSTCLRDVIVIQQLLHELSGRGLIKEKLDPTFRCTVFEDNKGCIELANAPKMRPRTRHIGIKYHHFREHVRTQDVLISYVNTDDQIADQFTKDLARDQFVKLRKELMGW